MNAANIAESLEKEDPVIPSSVPAPPRVSTRQTGTTKLTRASVIDLDRIIPDPDQPRREFDEVALHQLAESIRQFGVRQPINVRWDDALERFVIVSGERRWRAAQIAELRAIEALVEDKALDDRRVFLAQLTENIEREALNVIEIAEAYKKLIDLYGITQTEASRLVKVSKSQVSRYLKMLDFDPDIKRRIVSKEITIEQAEKLAKETSRDGRLKFVDKTRTTRRTIETEVDEHGCVVSVVVDCPHVPAETIYRGLQNALKKYAKDHGLGPKGRSREAG